MDFVWADLEKLINEVIRERLVLKPGENGWDKYAELVGEVEGYDIENKELIIQDEEYDIP